MKADHTYRGWHISYDPPPIPTRNCDWQFWHDDFDGAPDAGDNRCGSAASLEAAKAEIDLIEDEAQAEAEEAEDRRRANSLEPDFRRIGE